MPLYNPPSFVGSASALSILPDQVITPAEQRNAQLNLGVEPLFGLVAHINSGTNALAAGISSDGRSFQPIGGSVQWIPEVLIGTATVIAATNVWTLSGGVLPPNGTRVELKSTVTLPVPGEIRTGYFIRNQAGSAFELWNAATGGSVIDFTNTGAGVHSVFRVDAAIRDPDIVYYEPTDEWIMAYTHSTPLDGGDGYTPTLGIAKTRDFVNWTYIGEIPLNGTGITPTVAWMGSWLVDGGNYYVTALPFDGTADRESPGVGWVRCTNPGTWTAWTDFTAFRSTNPNFSPSRFLNDVHIQKVGSVYHLLVDGKETVGSGEESSGILHATSNSPLTNYSALECIISIDDIQLVDPGAGGLEGGSFIVLPDGNYRMFLQPVFGAMYSTDSANFVTWSLPKQIYWPGPSGVGNGTVIRLDTLAKQRAWLSAPNCPGLIRGGTTFGQRDILGEILPGTNYAFLINGTEGNGPAATTKVAYYIRSTGAGANAIEHVFYGNGYFTGNLTLEGNLSNLAGAIINAGGDIKLFSQIYDGANSAGSDGQVLKKVGGFPRWATP